MTIIKHTIIIQPLHIMDHVTTIFNVMDHVTAVLHILMDAMMMAVC